MIKNRLLFLFSIIIILSQFDVLKYDAHSSDYFSVWMTKTFKT